MPKLLSNDINVELGEVDERLRELIDFLFLALGGFVVRDDSGLEYKTDTEDTVETCRFWTKAITDRCALLDKLCREGVNKEQGGRGDA